jgi:hypothetical protein
LIRLTAEGLFARLHSHAHPAGSSPLHLQRLVSVCGRCRWARINRTNPLGKRSGDDPRQNFVRKAGSCQKKRVTCLGLSRLSQPNESLSTGQRAPQASFQAPCPSVSPFASRLVSQRQVTPLPSSSFVRKPYVIPWVVCAPWPLA